MKAPIQKGQWKLDEAADKRADQEFYRQLTEQAKSKGKDKPVILPTAIARR